MFFLNKNLNYSLLTNLINAIFPLISLPYVLRIMTPDIYGVYVYANVLFMMLYSLFILSLLPYAIRECTLSLSSIKCTETSIGETLGRIINLQFFLSLIAGGIHFIFFLLLKDEVISIAVACFLPTTFFLFTNVDWYFFSKQQYKPLFIRTIIIKSILLFMIFLLVKTKEDIYIYIILMSLSFLITNLIGFGLVFEKITWIKPSFAMAMENILKVKYFIFNTSVGVCYQYVDQLMVAVIATKSDLAHLNILKQVIGMSMMFPSTVCRFISPAAINAYQVKVGSEHHHHNFKRYIMLMLFIVIGLLLLGLPFLKLFAGNKFDFGMISVVFSSIVVIMTSLAVYIDTQHSIPSNLEKVTTLSNLSVLLISMSLFYPLFKVFGYTGIILSIAIGEFIGVLVMLLLHRFVFLTIPSHFFRRIF